MPDASNWDWAVQKKTVADLKQLRDKFKGVHEFVVSPDGEKIAAPVVNEENSFTAAINNDAWPETVELLWYLRFLPDGRLTALVRIDDQWTLMVDGVPWKERFEYAWDPRPCANGSAIGMMYKRDFKYGIAIDDKTWEEGFDGIRDFALSPDGSRAAATVQVAPLAEADIFAFSEGVWSIAVDGKAWDTKYINTWKPVFSADGSKVAAEIRTDICEYSVSVDGNDWNDNFGCVWEPLFRPQNGSVIVPVRKDGIWRLAENGKTIWDGKYNQLWHVKFSPDGSRIAAIASPEYGRWTIAVDNAPWKNNWEDMVLEPHFSPDGKRVAAIVKDNNHWTIAVDGQPWSEAFDMIWNPVFSPCGAHVIAKAERNGRFMIVADGKAVGPQYDALWEPVFSPDGTKILLKYIENDTYCRQVVSVSDVLG